MGVRRDHDHRAPARLGGVRTGTRSDSARRRGARLGGGGPERGRAGRNDAGVTTACGLGALESHQDREGVSMAKRATLRLQAMGSVDPRSANSSASPTASSTTGRAPDYYGRPSPRREAAGRSAATRTTTCWSSRSSSSCSTPCLAPDGRRAVECLRLDLGADLASANLVLTGTHSVWPQQREVVDLLAGGQACSTSCRCRSRGRAGCRHRPDRAGERRRPAAGAVLPLPSSRRGVSGATPLPARRRGHPSGAPAATVRFATRASASSPRSLTSTRSLALRAGRVRTALDDDGSPKRASAPTSGCPSSAASSSSPPPTSGW